MDLLTQLLLSGVAVALAVLPAVTLSWQRPLLSCRSCAGLCNA